MWLRWLLRQKLWCGRSSERNVRSGAPQLAATGSSEPKPGAAGSSEPQPAAAGSSEPQPAAARLPRHVPEEPVGGLPPWPRHVPEEPVGGLPPHPGPEHLLGFLWGLLMELMPYSRPQSQYDSKPLEPLFQVTDFPEGPKEGPLPLPVPEWSEAGLSLILAPGLTNWVSGLADIVSGLTDAQPDR
ncbi:hypothetical protein ILYODFUR_013262 [Ilyodon furcidens]|uniref:Uncharacterized protein n=1 Tax=Ilyodon furcidens TaxID=33524 RepID=A0ABV0URN4_9TELE